MSVPCSFRARWPTRGLSYDRFDAIVLVSVPTYVVLDCLDRPTNNPFGETAEQRLQILADIAEVEPLLRQAATHEIDADANAPLSHDVDILAGIAEA